MRSWIISALVSDSAGRHDAVALKEALSAIESIHYAQVVATGDGHLRISFQLEEKSREAAQATTHRLIDSCAAGIGLQPDDVHAIAR
jgi:hypothetical protein